MQNANEKIRERIKELEESLIVIQPTYNCFDLGSLTIALLRQDQDKMMQELSRLNNMLDPY